MNRKEVFRDRFREVIDHHKRIHHLNLVGIAARADVSLRWVRRLVSEGVSHVRGEHKAQLDKLCGYLGISPSQLWEQEPLAPEPTAMQQRKGLDAFSTDELSANLSLARMVALGLIHEATEDHKVNRSRLWYTLQLFVGRLQEEITKELNQELEIPPPTMYTMLSRRIDLYEYGTISRHRLMSIVSNILKVLDVPLSEAEEFDRAIREELTCRPYNTFQKDDTLAAAIIKRFLTGKDPEDYRRDPDDDGETPEEAIRTALQSL
ncbi:hypothetical protein GC163_13195 [bacterium]|nr:hypothetical protein [bacterium]